MVYAISNICQTAGLRFKKVKSSDELKHVPLLYELLNCFKYFIIIIYFFKDLYYIIHLTKTKLWMIVVNKHKC